MTHTTPRHVAVAGTGIAGVSAAWALVEAGVRVTLVGDGGGGATALASLVNPFTGPKASPAWQWEASLDALAALLDACGSDLRAGIVRPARDARQAAAFRARASAHPHALAWHDAADGPGIAAPDGWLDVRVGGVWADPATDLARLADRLSASGALDRVAGHVSGAGDAPGGAWLDVQHTGDGATTRLRADAVVLAIGDGLAAWSAFPAFDLARVGGRRYAAAHADADRLPAVAFGAYATPAGASALHIGGAYDHATPGGGPTAGEGAALADRLRRVLPGLGALVGPGEAAVRVHRAGVRRPLVRRVPGTERVWAFTGLGSKGLLAAPLAARGLPSWLGGAAVPDEIG